MLETNISSCWDPLGQVVEVTKARQGVVCNLQNDIDSFENVMCTSTGWLPIQSKNSM